MHRTWEFDVTSLLLREKNQLKVVLHSPLKAADEAFAQCATRGSEDAWEGFSHIPKSTLYVWLGTGALICRMRAFSVTLPL